MATARSKHFAAKVAERRKRLGLTFGDVNENGGPTAPTLAKAEAGALVDPRPSTLSKFDVGLKWMPGSAARTYWDGEEPTPREQSRAQRAALEPGSGMISLPVEVVLDLMRTQSKLNDAVETPAGVSADELATMVESLNKHVSTIVGLFVTDLLERNHAMGNQPAQPLIEYAFAELLAAPVLATDPDREDKLYRRWLLGKTGELSPELEASFRRRLRRCHPGSWKGTRPNV